MRPECLIDTKSVLLTSIHPFCLCSSPGKLLDVDDHYYRELSTSRSEPSISTEEEAVSSTPERRQSMEGRLPAEPRPAAASRQTRERAVTEPEPPKPTGDNRYVCDGSLSLVQKTFSIFVKLSMNETTTQLLVPAILVIITWLSASTWLLLSSFCKAAEN